MKKIHYIETEHLASTHGFVFHYMPLTFDGGEWYRPQHEPVAILFLDGWYNNKSKPIHVQIHPVSSPILKDIDEKPELIIAEVKEAIEILLNNPLPRMPTDQITDHVWTWVNA